MGICSDGNHVDCLHAHTANEVGDIMVWNGYPIEDYRSMGMFYKFATTCTSTYRDLLCATVRDRMKDYPTCAVPLTCANGGLANCGRRQV
tara:strand:+ start:220 stop:489 length:270 start_codon:yes stop_codon:yes gene_type:complete